MRKSEVPADGHAPTEEEKREEERFLAELVKVPKMTAEEAKAFRREFYGEK
jgi:hypothetical protein